jgi:hypothetical protein
MCSIDFCRIMFGMLSGPLALYGERALTCLRTCSLVIIGGWGSGCGYWKSIGTVEVFGFGGKKTLLNAFAFSSLVEISLIAPFSSFVFRVGVLDFPPSPMGFLMYLFVVHRSLSVAFSRKSDQCCFFVSMMALLYTLAAFLRLSWTG